MPTLLFACTTSTKQIRSKNVKKLMCVFLPSVPNIRRCNPSLCVLTGGIGWAAICRVPCTCFFAVTVVLSAVVQALVVFNDYCTLQVLKHPK